MAPSLESTPPPPQVTALLRRIAAGEQELGAELLELLYQELHELAAGLMRGERANHTLQPTALLHEAWLRIDPAKQEPAECRTHFLRLAARAMRSVLVDHARRRNALKRGGAFSVVIADEDELGQWDADAQRILDIEAALEKLTEKDAELAQIVELRFFGGLSAAQVAEALGKSRRQIEGSWAFARGWLRRELDRGGPDG